MNKVVALPTCRKCKRPLDNIMEIYIGTDHYYWDKNRLQYLDDLPSGRTDDPSKYICNYCGRRLMKKEVEFVEAHKE